eukprot:GHVU01135152.1.p1 GENE.GHVU01135152.1~~GHVU01135152.1.p1  ORF type:complete len:292 (+),score=49.94 GHVU01135152.1:158-1033(+)
MRAAAAAIGTHGAAAYHTAYSLVCFPAARCDAGGPLRSPPLPLGAYSHLRGGRLSCGRHFRRPGSGPRRCTCAHGRRHTQPTSCLRAAAWRLWLQSLADSIHSCTASKLEALEKEHERREQERAYLAAALQEDKERGEEANTRMRQLQQALSSAETAREAAHEQALALQTRVATVQSEFENARNSARDAEATQESEVVRLREALEKASAESDARMQQREATGAEVQALQTAVADASADREHEKRRTVQSSLEVEEDRLQWQNAGRMRDAQIAALKADTERREDTRAQERRA